MNEFAKRLAEDRRLCVLRLLKETGGRANESVLQSGLEALGHTRLSRETVRSDIRFLIDCGCLTDEFYGEVQVVTLTRRGLEAAEGRITIEGIKRPSIGV